MPPTPPPTNAPQGSWGPYPNVSPPPLPQSSGDVEMYYKSLLSGLLNAGNRMVSLYHGFIDTATLWTQIPVGVGGGQAIAFSEPTDPVFSIGGTMRSNTGGGGGVAGFQLAPPAPAGRAPLIAVNDPTVPFGVVVKMHQITVPDVNTEVFAGSNNFGLGIFGVNDVLHYNLRINGRLGPVYLPSTVLVDPTNWAVGIAWWDGASFWSSWNGEPYQTFPNGIEQFPLGNGAADLSSALFSVTQLGGAVNQFTDHQFALWGIVPPRTP